MADDQKARNPEQCDRRGWMGLLARATVEDLESAWNDLGDKPAHDWLRPPETGLVMVRGRAGGTGSPFNLGEMTVTRCAIKLADGTAGIAYVRGRNPRHGELAALFDALLQKPERKAEIERQVLRPLAETETARGTEAGRKAAATKVDFFTMVRGED